LKVECGEPPPDGGGGWGTVPPGGGGGWGAAPPGVTDEEERKQKVNKCLIFITVLQLSHIILKYDVSMNFTFLMELDWLKLKKKTKPKSVLIYIIPF